MINTDQIKELRSRTGVSVMQCKKALEEADGDMEKALVLLHKKSGEIASKKAGRTLGAGAVASYIHGTGNIGAMVELLCETDFVAKNDDFKVLARDIAMHVAAFKPEFLSEDEVTEEARQKARDAFLKEVEESDKPKEVKEKMLTGKVDTYFKEKILLDQQFLKNPEVTVRQLVEQAVQKFGEKTEVGRFVCFSI